MIEKVHECGYCSATTRTRCCHPDNAGNECNGFDENCPLPDAPSKHDKLIADAARELIASGVEPNFGIGEVYNAVKQEQKEKTDADK